ncbi:MAG: SMP-30/gluconolactonase/LRE family protein [Candidatus Hydrogenedentota bacterium]
MNRRSFLQASAAIAATTAVDQEPPVRYPDPSVEVLDPRFQGLIAGSAAVEVLYRGTRWGEGPVWFGDGRYLLWSDIPNDRILRWEEETGEVTEFRHPSNDANGNTRDLQGRLLTCERRQLTRTEYDGSITVLADSFDGKPLNGPNDVIVHSDGHIWFTDPGYGTLSLYEGLPEPHELPTRVYRLDPESGNMDAIIEEEKPNGLAFSPDYKKFYLADTGISHKPGHPRQMLVFDVIDGKKLKNRQVFCDMAPGVSDGFRVDVHGNIWTSAGWGGEEYDGVHVFAPDGDIIGKIHLPEVCANVCFGGPKRNRLFMAASQSLYSLFTNTQGMQAW